MVRNLGIGTGRRKTAVARVYLREGSGKITVNNLELDKYFPIAEVAGTVRQPLIVTASDNKFDIVINVVGGGSNGQA
ncbi:MAG: 30S ribosomal protein S9, partial [Spirochaetae bacterium HGW-Spirochaetae-7]